jgi:hypothetical protein
MSKSEEFVKGVWKQEPLLHTPQELTHLATSLTSHTHPDFGGENGPFPLTGPYATSPDNTENNQLRYMGGNKESAAGECDKACRMVHDYLPHGSHVKEYRDSNANDHQYGNHYVHHVPTTHGMYVVDYTHRQFNANAHFPVVEPQDKFEARKSMQRFAKNRDVDHRVL